MQTKMAEEDKLLNVIPLQMFSDFKSAHFLVVNHEYILATMDD